MNGRPTISSRALGIVAILLAVAIATAINLIVLAVLFVAITKKSDVNGGISENATQILTGWGGGIIGILGAYVGYRAAQSAGEPVVEPPAEDVVVEEKREVAAP